MPWIRSGSAMIALTRHPRVERRVRVLEDDLQLAAQSRAVCRARAASTSWPSNRTDPDVGSMQPQDAAPGRRLAAARLPDQAERLGPADREADARHGLHLADRRAEQAGPGPGSA